MSFEIRRACPEDAFGIADVKRDTWPDEKTDVDTIRKAIYNSLHHTLVAHADEKIIGFVDGFSTLSSKNILRYEVDLLAVAPGFRKKGVARKLVEAQIKAAAEVKPVLYRALIHHENVASQAVFKSCGFRMGEVCGLYISSPQNSGWNVNKTYSCHLIPVETMLYQGLWLEDASSAEDFPYARQVSYEKKCEMVGGVIPDAPLAVQKTALENGFKFQGKFHWWVRQV